MNFIGPMQHVMRPTAGCLKLALLSNFGFLPNGFCIWILVSLSQHPRSRLIKNNRGYCTKYYWNIKYCIYNKNSSLHRLFLIFCSKWLITITLCFYVMLSSVAHLETQMTEAIQQEYNMSSPPVLTIANIGKPTVDETTTQVHCF